MAIFEDFQDVAALGCAEHRQAPIVEDQQVHTRDGFEHACTPSIPLGDRQGFEQARDAVIGDGSTVATGLVAKSTGNPTFAETGFAGDQ
jgi:hypothetical protein